MQDKQDLPSVIQELKYYRSHFDSFGHVRIQIDKLWGPQTQRSIEFFSVAKETDRMPLPVIKAFAILKKCAAKVNMKYGLDPEKAHAIIKVCNQILDQLLNDQFPLVVWQTGSGTQTNMNVNQVISNRGKIYLTDQSKNIHPNNQVNMGQSSNDSFPTAMHIATVIQLHKKLLPSLAYLSKTLMEKIQQFKDIVKIGRTHTQDATPISLGQQFSGYYQQIKNSTRRIEKNIPDLLQLAQGGTAVGTGLNTFKNFAEEIAQQIANETKFKFISNENKFQALSSHDTLIQFHSSLNTLAVSLMKIANDIRFLGSGPRAGIGELILPQNEPGSSIMPGKVNPTQCEAMTMICAQVMGNNVAVTISGSNGHFQLNVFKPIIIKNILYSMQLLSEGIQSFTNFCLKGLKPNMEKINQNLKSSLMIVTALTPVLGYDNAGQIAKYANKNGLTLKQSFLLNNKAIQTLKKHYNYDFTQEQIIKKFDELVNPKLMLEPAQYKHEQNQNVK